MYTLEEAKRRIEEARVSNHTELNLSELSLSEVPAELYTLTSLKKLILNYNKLSSLSDEISNLINLEELELGFNFFYEFPEEILSLKNSLKLLNISGNSLSTVSENIYKLTKLEELHISDNEITFLPIGFRRLKSLKQLFFRFNNKNINTLPNEIFRLKDLEVLYLSGNGIVELSNEIKNLINLKKLYLSSNKIKSIPKEIINLEKLEILDIRYNFEIKIPSEILNDYKNPQKILNFVRDFYAGKEKGTNLPLNEGKIILIGQGNVGKTSLRKCLVDGVCEIDQPKTEGLEVVKWNLSGLNTLHSELNIPDAGKYMDVTMNIWDFGGQEIYHTTHQFFFNSRCLYILVGDFDEREEWKTNRIEYWLKTIEFLIRGEENESNDKIAPERNKPRTPVIIIGNKADKNREKASPIDKSKLEEKYPSIEIVDFIPISCTKGENIGKVIETILGQFEKIGVFTEIPAKYADARAKIQADERPFISQSEFGEFCAAEDAAQIRSILNDIGTIKAFGEDKKIGSQKLKDLIILKPNWITEGIYKILSANHLLDTKNGIATKEEIRNLLDETVYPNIDVIIEMMEEFYICRQRQVEDKKGNKIDECIFPSFFSIQRPQGYVSIMREPSENKIEFVYEYPLLSDSVISFFIIEASKEKYDTKEFWREGAYLENETGDKALIEADSEENKITITVKSDSLELSERILNDVKKIFDEVHNKEFIPSPNPIDGTKIGEEIETSAKANLSDEQFKYLERQLTVKKEELENSEKQMSSMIEKLKSFVEELADHRAKPKLNIFFLLFTSIPLLIIILAIYYGSIIAGGFGIALIILQMYFSYKRRKEWSLLKAPEQIIEDEKKKIIKELGFNEKQQKLLK